MTQMPAMWRDEFLAVRDIPGLGLCAVQRFIYSCGLLTNLSFDGASYDYDARYCYPSEADAMADLREWDGKGDPPGDWIKEKISARVKGID